MKPGRVIGIIAASLIGLAIGVLIGWAVGQTTGSRIQVVEGYAYVNEDGAAISLSPDGEAPGTGYVIAGSLWREKDGPWHDTFPTCLEPLITGQETRLGVLQTRPQGDAPGRSVVVWLECLNQKEQNLFELPANNTELAQGALLGVFEHPYCGDYPSASALWGSSKNALTGHNPELGARDSSLCAVSIEKICV